MTHPANVFKDLRVLVTGGRKYNNQTHVFGVLDAIHKTYGISLIIHGAAKGADSLAEKWAKSREVPYLGVPARWIMEGNSAGPKRNTRMLIYDPHVIVAFAGNTGTNDMKQKGQAAGKIVWQY